MSFYFTDKGLPKEKGKRKVCLATTVYDCIEPAYTFAMSKCREVLHKRGIQTAYFLLQGNCHVDDARNSIVKEFLHSDCDELIFIDADSGWEPKDLVRICKHDVDVVGGVVPYRAENRKAMPVRMAVGVNGPDDRGLMKVDGLGTAFLRIQRKVLEKLFDQADKHNTEFGKGEKTAIIFERTFADGIRFGGDLSFCNKARAAGFECYADFEMILTHVGKTVFRGSLGQTLRRANSATVAHVAKILGDKAETIETIEELVIAIGNSYSMDVPGLTTLMLLARKADGPILEAGSGLSTLVMAAANPDQIVYCLEHDEGYAKKLRSWANSAGLTNIGLCLCPIKDGWYDLEEMDGLPEHFSLALVDGPPQTEASRMPFFEQGFADRCDTVVCDDAGTHGYADKLNEWADLKGRTFNQIDPRMVIIGETETVECLS